ncbi:MAG: NADP-dependent malic enzyme, partial [Phaeodactylibacter sp.]|nr:NADP-dependent malic enzyme [Phaeodactylibacter sp.]
LITTVAPAVARAAMESGVARHPVADWAAYELELSRRLGNDNTISRIIETKARQDVKRVVLVDAEHVSVLKAAQIVLEERIAQPILLGKRETIDSIIAEYGLSLPGVRVIDPKNPVSEEEVQRHELYSHILYGKRKRKGVTLLEARDLMRSRSYYGVMMVEAGDADALVGGVTKKYPYTVRPALQIIGPREGVRKVASTHILITRFGPLFLADTSINHHLAAEDIADIAELVAEKVQSFDITPRIAMVTYSNFGSVPNGESAVLMRRATAILQQKHPDWAADGEMQANMALNPAVREQFYPFSKLGEKRANTLIFPNLSAANIAYNLLAHTANMDIIGPILLGMKKPVHILQMGASVRQIVDMMGIAAVDAQGR